MDAYNFIRSSTEGKRSLLVDPHERVGSNSSSVNSMLLLKKWNDDMLLLVAIRSLILVARPGFVPAVHVVFARTP